MSRPAPFPPSGTDLKDLLENAGYDAERHDAALEKPNRIESMQPLVVEDEPIGDVDELRRWLARNAH